MSVSSVLGSTLYRYWGNDYSVTSGNGLYNDDVAGADALHETNAPNETTTSGGSTILDYVAASNHVLWTQSTIGALPTYNSAHSYLWACCVRVDSTPDGSAVLMRGTDDISYWVNFGGEMEVHGCVSDDSVVGAGELRIIVVSTGSSTKMWINGVLQSDTGGGGLGTNWKTATHYVGSRNGGERLDGLYGHIVFAYSATEDMEDYVADLDAALLEVWEGAGGDTPVEGEIAASGTGTAAIAGVVGVTGTVAASGTGTAAAAGAVGKTGAITSTGTSTGTISGVVGRIAAIAAAGVSTMVALFVRGYTAAISAIGQATAAIAAALGRTGTIAASGTGTAQLTGTVEEPTPVLGAISSSSSGSCSLSGVVGVTGAISATGTSTASLTGTVETADPSPPIRQPRRLSLRLGLGL